MEARSAPLVQPPMTCVSVGMRGWEISSMGRTVNAMTRTPPKRRRRGRRRGAGGMGREGGGRHDGPEAEEGRRS